MSTPRLTEQQYAEVVAGRKVGRNHATLPVAEPKGRKRVAGQGRLILNLTIDGEPVPKGRPRFAKNGRVYTPKETKEAEQNIGWRIKELLRGIEPDETHAFRVETEFHCASSKCDVDNLLKLVLDSANKLVWKDDRQVVGIQAIIYRNAVQPRTVLSIYITVAP